MTRSSQRRLLFRALTLGALCSTSCQDAEEDFPSIECTDNHENCQLWSEHGECTKTSDYMWKYCCGSCMKETFGVDQIVDKDYMKEIEQTIEETEVYLNQLYVDERTCKNKEERCSFWKVLGECEQNPEYMLRTCAAACQSCHERNSGSSKTQQKDNLVVNSECDQQLNKLIGNDQVFDNVVISIHRNSEPESCANVKGSGDGASKTFLRDALRRSVQALVDKTTTCSPTYFDKYKVEALLTNSFADLLPTTSCSDDKSPEDGFLEYCDLGPDRTAIQHDHNMLVRVGNKLPCRFFTREGLQIKSFRQLIELSQKANRKFDSCSDRACSPDVHLYAVSAGRQFMLPASYVGEEFHLPHVRGADGKNGLSLRVLSTSPRLFEISNLINFDEISGLLERIKAETHPERRLSPSMVGGTQGGNNGQRSTLRTGENGWVHDGKGALDVGLRVFNMLAFDKASEATADGFQIVKYKKTEAYIPHLDYQSRPNTTRYNYDSAGKGGNRYATILFYLTDIEEGHGGETVFPKVWPIGQSEVEHVELDKALEVLRASGDANGFERGSWEEKMVAQCRSRLAVKPKKGKAIMFYSQLPDGSPDQASLHGGCPLLSGGKYAANLWVWNLPRERYPGAPLNKMIK